MANKKFSQFTAGAAYNPTNNGLGAIAGFTTGTTVNNIWTPNEIALGLSLVTSTPYSIYAADGTLSSDRTITIGSNTLAMSSSGGHTVTFSGANNSGMAITGGNNYIVSSNGTYAISSVAISTSDAIVLRTSANASADTSILIDSRSPGVNADLHLKTATKLKIELPVTATVGYVLKADDVYGNVSWGAETDTDTGITSVTYVIGAGQTTPLTGVITSRALELTSNKYGGTNQVGYVPQGGTGTTFLRGDGTWVTPTDTTDNAVGAAGQLQYTNGSGVFQATSDMVYTTDQLKVQNTLYLDGNNANAGIVKLGCEAAGASHYVGLEGPTHGGANAYIIKFPDATPTANQILKVNTVVSSTANMIWAADTDTNTNIANTDLTLGASRTLGLGADQNLTFTGSGTSKITFSNTGGAQFDEDVTFVKNSIIQGQAYTELHTVSTTGSFTPDWNDSNVQTMVLSATTTVNNPSNIKVGATYILILKQPDAGDVYDVGTWGSKYKFPGGVLPTLTATNGKADVITIIAYSADILMCAITQDFVTA